jgi:hypothetical protein
MRLRSELGILRSLVNFLREWIYRFLGQEWLAVLSERFITAAKELGLRSCHQLFGLQHGTISSDYFRSLAEVLEVITCDLPNAAAVQLAIHATVSWYWASRAASFTAASLTRLRELSFAMRESWRTFEGHVQVGDFRAAAAAEYPRGSLDSLPKMHRAVLHLPDAIREYGPYDALTTEASESANKPLKCIFRAYVASVR